jgi:hypothetical protein
MRTQISHKRVGHVTVMISHIHVDLSHGVCQLECSGL